MSRKHTAHSRPGKKAELERKRDERAARRALVKERKNRAGEAEDAEEFVSFTNQLQVLGLRMREVPGDGNCLFRALGDQMEGHSRNHLKHRQETVDYMIRHRDDFEPFVEDDVPFDKHVGNLAQPGTFAGNDAIVAFARSNQMNIIIHQLNNPLWHIKGSDKTNVRELHIAYRYGEHYDSVRRINDNAETPANLQTEMLFKDESNRKGKPKSNPSDERRGDAVQKVRNATGCPDVRLILQNLEAESYDVESTIQVILQITELKRIADGGTDFIAEGSCYERPQHTQKDGTASKTKTGPKAAPLEDTADPRNVPDENKDNLRQKVPREISNKQRKEQQRVQKKKRQEDRHRQRVQELRPSTRDNNRQDKDANPSGVTVVKALGALNI